MLETILGTLPTTTVTVADRSPRPVHLGTTTAEQKVIVQFVFLRR